LFSADPKGEPENVTRTESTMAGNRVQVTRISNHENQESHNSYSLPISRVQLADRRQLQFFRCDCCNFTTDYFKELNVDGLTVTDCYGCNIAIQNVKGSIELINCEDVRVIIYGTVSCVIMDGCVNARIRLFKSSFDEEFLVKMAQTKLKRPKHIKEMKKKKIKHQK